jgi:diguanylate cyclase (GGDEF)-like protein/PAS domain S-box-containing protein
MWTTPEFRQHLVEAAPDGILVVDPACRIHFVNPALAHLCGHPREALLGQSIDMLLPPSVLSRHQHHVQRYFARPRAHPMGSLGKQRLMHRDGREVAVNIALGHHVATNEQPYAILFVRDATHANEQHQQLEQLALTDPLTGLYNRHRFQERLAQALDHARRSGRMLAVCLVDLDDFKSINNGHGYEAGDALLRDVAERLKSSLRWDDTLARVGSDEFAILLQDLPSPAMAVHVANKVIQRLAQPAELGSATVFSGASVGIAYGPQDMLDAPTLVHQADMAMHMAKAAGRGVHAVYDPAMAQQVTENLKIRERLQLALTTDSLKLHYQPQVEGQPLRVTSAEALLRWHDTELGQVPPDQFIAVAEASGLILPLGDWVLDEACRQISAWQHLGLNIRVAVNVSAQQFRHRNLVLQVASTLQRHGTPAHLLELEVTETAAMSDPQQAAMTLQQLLAMGVGVALDDFGRGHSSLSHLLQLPVDRLKIDRSFISGIPHSADHIKITKAIMGLASSLEKQVVAEGVETPEQLAFLRQAGCTCFQGWLFSKAVPAQDLPQVVQQLGGIAP